jgi:pimeloyl-ACP methyl ester carboxylesterase
MMHSFFGTSGTSVLAGAFVYFGLMLGSAHATCPTGADPARTVDAGETCLAISVYGASTAGATPKLVVLIHGDVSDGGPADYLYPLAQSLAKPGVVTIALLRHGYSDSTGGVSQGSDSGRRDHYTAANVAGIGKAISALKARYKAGRVIVMGHSGGAAITGVLIGRTPGLIDAAALVSCPCDIPRWRTERKGRPWSASLSPQAFAGSVPKSTTVVTITGSSDDNTSPALAKDYIGALSSRGVSARHEDVTGAGHSFKSLAPAVTAALQRLL